MNQLLQNSLAEYGITGDKVTRMIAAAKTGWYYYYLLILFYVTIEIDFIIYLLNKLVYAKNEILEIYMFILFQ